MDACKAKRKPGQMAEITLVEKIEQIDPDEWDELAKRNITASYEWLHLVEDTSMVPRQFQFILAREKSRLQAAVFFHKQLQTGWQTSLNNALFGYLTPILRKAGLTLLPALIGHSAVGHRQTILFREGLPEINRQHLLSEMLEFIENIVLKEDLTLCLRNVPDNDAGLASVFTSRHYLCSPEWPVCYLDIQWKSFAEYLHALRIDHPKTEKNIHREINHSRKAGITFQRLYEPTEIGKHLHSIVSSHYFRLNGVPLPFQSEFFEQLKNHLKDKAVIDTAALDGRIIGAQVRLERDGYALVPMIGIDADFHQKHSVYFNLGYNQTIRNGIEEGLKQIRFGTLLYDTKIRRGCKLFHSHMYLRPKKGLADLLLRSLLPFRTLRMRYMLPPVARKFNQRKTLVRISHRIS